MACLEGMAPFHVPDAGKDVQTWYKVFGDLTGSQVPLIALHGGPGIHSSYMAPLADLASHHNIPVVLYDQVGCGNSTRLAHKNGDHTFWTVELFERELDNLIQHLGIKQFDLLGHSWGGMLGSVYAAKNPPGLRKLVIVSSPASLQTWLQSVYSLLERIPEKEREDFKRYEAEGNFDAPEYKAACMLFYTRHLCRCDPWPEELDASMNALEEDATVYGTMYGPSEITCNGVLKTWTAIPTAHQITSPTLLINGEFDEAQEVAVAPFFERIPKVKWITLANCSHTAMWEDREKFTQVVSTFLTSAA